MKSISYSKVYEMDVLQVGTSEHIKCNCIRVKSKKVYTSSIPNIVKKYEPEIVSVLHNGKVTQYKLKDLKLFSSEVEYENDNRPARVWWDYYEIN